MIELTLSALFLCGVTLPNLPDYFLPGCGRSWTRIQLSFQHILLCWCYQQSYLLTVNQDEGPPPLMNAKNTWKPPVTAAVCLSDGEKIATMNTVSIRWSCYSELCLNPNMSAESKTYNRQKQQTVISVTQSSQQTAPLMMWSELLQCYIF